MSKIVIIIQYPKFHTFTFNRSSIFCKEYLFFKHVLNSYMSNCYRFSVVLNVSFPIEMEACSKFIIKIWSSYTSGGKILKSLKVVIENHECLLRDVLEIGISVDLLK